MPQRGKPPLHPEQHRGGGQATSFQQNFYRQISASSKTAPSCMAVPGKNRELFSETADPNQSAKEPGNLEHISPGLQPWAF